MKALYIIPARGGSKGIPHKNIVPLGGKPLLCHTIDAVMAVENDLTRIILSTDDTRIREVAEGYGLPVGYSRPAQLATDTAGSREVILDAMDYADRMGIDYDVVVLLQPTSPLRTAGDITATLAAYTPGCDMAVTVTEVDANPYYNCYEPDSDGYLTISKGAGNLTRRQDAPVAYQMNGAVYAINPVSIRQKTLGQFTRRIPVTMPTERSVDIDTPLDLAIAETLLNHNPRQTL